MTLEEYFTLFAKIEGILNSRPLCAISSDSNDLDVLTPAHFLTGASFQSLPESDCKDSNTGHLSRWQLIKKLYQSLWHRWHREYLVTLTERQKWLREPTNLNQDDLVIVHNPNAPPTQWLLGRVVETHPGRDGIVRVATVRTKDGHLKRPTVKLCRLPIQ